MADSHLHAYVRTKLALTEPEPVIRPWDVDTWAELPDSRLPVQPSLDLLAGLHARWAELYSSVDGPGWERCFVHPDLAGRAGRPPAAWAQAFQADEQGRVRLARWLAVYIWHGQHHTAHILGLRQRKGW
ncbi:hypothetical protein ACFSC4_07870 [Deinococcus malanensis]|uniref:hypothetical protein n=1 Tax=Deinococcus malanensis TaxID=1706855 RepID=UPI00363C6ED6